MRPDEHQKKASRAWNRAHPEGRGGSNARGRGGRGGAPPSNPRSTNNQESTNDDVVHASQHDKDKDAGDSAVRTSYSKRTIESNEYRFIEQVEDHPNLPPGRPAPLSDEQIEQERADKELMHDIKEFQKEQWEQGRYQDLKERQDIDVRQIANALKQAPVKRKLDLSKFASASASASK
ncbi:hypothetical protein SeMB42_g05263 [Synchytrium endobioticum]|uniref:Uncharacterized protein n=1 Tax=Synchytrium endobioticum TaxID=286115 RepID=A0A507CJ46_9FUNG|nr:hypothetical protein SeLEV6574_g07072 [Synchytrium endobioticum]TPX42146.1 hypothetical protein SeMB42_g05263 [Synchytrium endobioticum]